MATNLVITAAAHERWVKHALKSAFDRSLFEAPGLVNLGTLAAVLALAAVLLVLSARTRRERHAESRDGRGLGPWAQAFLRVTYGAGLVLVAWHDQFLAPDLVSSGSQGYVLVKLQAVAGVLLVLGLMTRPAAWGSLALFVWALVARPFQPFDGAVVSFVQVLNYLEVAGIAVFLGVAGGGALALDSAFAGEGAARLPRAQRARAVGLMRILLGATLILLGLQKFLVPELPMGVVQNYADQIYAPIASLTGISPEGYVFAACVVETAVGVLVLCGIFTRTIMVVLAALFVTTLVIFREEVLAHLPLFGMVAVFLVEGAGSLRLDSLLVRPVRERELAAA